MVRFSYRQYLKKQDAPWLPVERRNRLNSLQMNTATPKHQCQPINTVQEWKNAEFDTKRSLTSVPQKKTHLKALDASDIYWSSKPNVVNCPAYEGMPTILFQTNENTRPVVFLFKFIPESFFEVMMEQTNLYVRQQQQRHNKPLQWRQTTVAEMKAFVAIRRYMHLVPLHRLEMYWSEEYGVPFVKKLFPLHRFQQLEKYWHFNDSRDINASKDSYHKVRPLFEVIRNACRTVYVPGQKLTVDEGILEFTGRSNLTVYMPDKPHQWGFKVFLLTDAVTFNVCDLILYDPTQKGEQPTEKVVLDLVERFEGSYRHVYFDNGFTGIPLEVELWRKGLLAAGTMRRNRKGFPAEFKRTQQRKPATKRKRKQCQLNRGPACAPENREEKGEEKHKQAKKQQGDYCCLHSGVLTCTNFTDRSNVTFLSTIPNAHDPSFVYRTQKNGERKQIPCATVVKEYNKYMIGVDKHNQLRETYKANRKTKKWSVSLADDLIAIAETNAFICYREFGPNQLSHFDFISQLCHELASDFSAWRYGGTASQHSHRDVG